jgi:hypothetical protein
MHQQDHDGSRVRSGATPAWTDQTIAIVARSFPEIKRLRVEEHLKYAKLYLEQHLCGQSIEITARAAVGPTTRRQGKVFIRLHW